MQELSERPLKIKALVGAGRFERPTPCAQGRCATRLRYAPTSEASSILNHFHYLRHHAAAKIGSKSRRPRQNSINSRSRLQNSAAPHSCPPAEPMRRLPLHLQLQLPVLFEDLSVDLPRQLGYPFVGHAAGA